MIRLAVIAALAPLAGCLGDAGLDPGLGQFSPRGPAESTPRPAAGPVCDERGTVLEVLAANWGEVPAAIGLANGGGLVEVLVSSRGDTWSLIVTAPDGTSCLVATGEGWRAAPRREEEEPEA